MRILLVEDDQATAEFIANGLREHGHVVEHLVDGRDGLVLATTSTFEVIILDRMVPGLDGLSILRTLRAAGNKSPILILTTMDAVTSRVDGLEAGADDYLVKPFAFSELHARIIALSRRPPISESHKTSLKAGSLEIDLLKRAVTREGIALELQPQEYRLLEYLVRNADRVVTRTMLLEHVWEFQFDPKTTVVETHISRLRSKIDKGFDRELIQTIRNVGYVLRST